MTTSKEALWKNFSPEKQVILKRFLENSKGLAPSQMLPLLLDTKEQLQKNHLSFTKEEQKFLFEELENKNMSAQEQFVFQTMKQMLFGQTS